MPVSYPRRRISSVRKISFGKNEANEIFGAFCSTPLPNSNFYIGDPNTHLIRIKPELRRIDTKFAGKNFMVY